MSYAIKLGLVLFVSIIFGVLNSIRTDTSFLTPKKIDLYEEIKINLPYGIKAFSLKETIESFKNNDRVFIDARLKKYYKKSHIEDAESLPIYNIEENISLFMEKYPFQTPLLIYCGSIHCDSSTRLASKLKDVGYIDISVFIGGWAEWQKQFPKK